MMSSAQEMSDTDTIRACTVSRDVQNFDLLIEDMEAEFANGWGDLSYVEALSYLDDDASRSLEMIAIALDDADESSLGVIKQVIEKATAQSIRVLLIAEELSPIILHQLLRAGAQDFVPYPLPEGALHESIMRLEQAKTRMQTPQAPINRGNKHGAVFAVQSLAGGAGGTNFAINLAWELARHNEASPKTVCILDFDFQSGTVSTYLDLPRTEKVYEMLSQTASMDVEGFLQSTQRFQEKLVVLTAPSDMLPLDLLSPDEIERVVTIARENFDFVIIDMPRAIVHWTETVLTQCEIYFALLELDMRSAQNTLRLIRALKADGLSTEKYHFILNRAPRFTDLGGKSRAKRLAESLGIRFGVQLPDGGTQLRDANDHGLPLAEFAPKNPVLKEIRKLAQELHSAATSDAVAAE